MLTVQACDHTRTRRRLSTGISEALKKHEAAPTYPSNNPGGVEIKECDPEVMASRRTHEVSTLSFFA
jgi:hypothetical protein